MNVQKAIEVLKTIQTDMQEDAKRFDGQPFTGKTVAEYFGCHGAAIAALARLMQGVLEERGEGK